MSPAQVWRLWHDGGVFRGVSYPFGMAQLAQYVRRTLGAQNLFWIEGPDISSSFAGMVSQGALLKVSGVVYSVHHPAGPHDAASWDADFGYLVTTGVAPVVDGEWTNYEPAPAPGPSVPHSSCWQDAPVTVPAYLKYLAAHGIGLNVYQLQPGYMIKSYRDMSVPTTINPGTWSCLPSLEPQPGQGAGSLVLAWFRQQNGPRPGGTRHRGRARRRCYTNVTLLDPRACKVSRPAGSPPPRLTRRSSATSLINLTPTRYRPCNNREILPKLAHGTHALQEIRSGRGGASPHVGTSQARLPMEA